MQSLKIQPLKIQPLEEDYSIIYLYVAVYTHVQIYLHPPQGDRYYF